MISVSEWITQAALDLMEQDLLDGDPSSRWTGESLSEYSTHEGWNAGQPLPADMSGLAEQINATFLERHPDWDDLYEQRQEADNNSPAKKRVPKPVRCYVKPDATENWYRIPETPDYFISQYLRVMRVTPGQRTHPGQLINPQDRKGHACVHLPMGWRRLTTLWARARGREPWKDWTAINKAKKRVGV
jgi:hypothetical protein